jgi:hypothetical protein
MHGECKIKYLCCLPFQVFFSWGASQQTATLSRSERLRLHSQVSKPEDLLRTHRSATRIYNRGCPDYLRRHTDDYQAPRFEVLHPEEDSRNIHPSNCRTEPSGTWVGWQRSGPHLDHARFQKWTWATSIICCTIASIQAVFWAEGGRAASCSDTVLTDNKQSDVSWAQRVVKSSLYQMRWTSQYRCFPVFNVTDSL